MENTCKVFVASPTALAMALLHSRVPPEKLRACGNIRAGIAARPAWVEIGGTL